MSDDKNDRMSDDKRKKQSLAQNERCKIQKLDPLGKLFHNLTITQSVDDAEEKLQTFIEFLRTEKTYKDFMDRNGLETIIATTQRFPDSAEIAYKMLNIFFDVSAHYDETKTSIRTDHRRM